MIAAGDRVRLVVLPPWVDKLPPESQRVFRHCVGRIFRVAEITAESEGDLLVLDVGPEVDARFGGIHNDIRVERIYLESA